ncbi:fructosamine kinase [Lasiosphaeris hirsuta]|uniref:protein-ribulosamine 3-kinase n=1 Tax=Lasiosphaeris hirsuta TaxID=260670 RepID=A0AA39ZW16_9PEZI|nr:fructosamine kinase [Lasiosphaeris hirsuta]
MLPAVDPAILQALGLEATSSKMISHGGSGFASSFKLTSVKDGEEVAYFIKTGTGEDASVMFRGEHTSLNAIHATIPTLCPQSHAHGALQASPNRHFLATDFLDLHVSAPAGSGLSLAAKLARLHTTPAPVPRDLATDALLFGFPVPTCCGATAQDNSWRASWAEFYADNRLRAVLRAGVGRNGGDGELEGAVERVAAEVVPRLLGEAHLSVVPVVVHGDLWSGNHGRGRIAGGGVEEVVYDPSCVYGHSEYELGIMRMFGGFGSAFWREYERLVPKAEPVEEWDDRVALYELYHYLNHFALFGGGYRNGAMAIMRRLISKYGSGQCNTAG